MKLKKDDIMICLIIIALAFALSAFVTNIKLFDASERHEKGIHAVTERVDAIYRSLNVE